MVGEGSGQIRIHANYTWSSSHSRKPGTVWCNAATIETSINSSIDFIKKIFQTTVDQALLYYQIWFMVGKYPIT
jgi:hypothetical protein